MEAAFREDFSEVRLHTSDHRPSQYGVSAFASGNDVHFAAPAAHLYTPQGSAELGHELTHIVQQRQGRVAGPGRLNRNPLLEQEANEAGAAIARGQRPVLQPGSAARDSGGVTAGDGPAPVQGMLRRMLLRAKAGGAEQAAARNIPLQAGTAMFGAGAMQVGRHGGQPAEQRRPVLEGMDGVPWTAALTIAAECNQPPVRTPARTQQRADHVGQNIAAEPEGKAEAKRTGGVLEPSGTWSPGSRLAVPDISDSPERAASVGTSVEGRGVVGGSPGPISTGGGPFHPSRIALAIARDQDGNEEGAKYTTEIENEKFGIFDDSKHVEYREKLKEKGENVEIYENGEAHRLVGEAIRKHVADGDEKSRWLKGGHARLASVWHSTDCDPRKHLTVYLHSNRKKKRGIHVYEDGTVSWPDRKP